MPKYERVSKDLALKVKMSEKSMDEMSTAVSKVKREANAK
jgi:hypothetical protein